MAGKRVLHLDENDFYGSTTASHPLQKLDEILKAVSPVVSLNGPAPCLEELPASLTRVQLMRNPQTISHGSTQFFQHPPESDESSMEGTGEETVSIEEQLSKDSRKYDLDLLTNLMWARGSDVNNLVKSGTHRYLEFHCMKQSLLYRQEESRFLVAPVTKKDIFRSKDISLVDKRNLMRFVTNIMQPTEQLPEVPEGGQKAVEEVSGTFVDFMTKDKLSESLQSLVLYMVCLCATEAGVKSSYSWV